jgi:hypothetical protein
MEEQSNEQLTKKESKQLRRQERNEEQESLIRKKKMKKILKWGIGILVAGGAIYGLVILSRQSGIVKEQIGESFPIQGQTHIAVGATHPAYNSDPPTSGWHYAQPANWGVYQNELPDEQLIHNLEHGGIWISYKGIDDATISALEKIAKSESKIILEPRSKDDAPIVLASWGRLQKLQIFDEAAVRNFISANKNQSPEPLAQ